MGISGAFGGGAADAINDIMRQRLLQAQLGEQMRASRVQEAQHQQTIDQQAAYQRLMEQDRQDRLAETAYQHRQGEAAKTLEDTLKAADVITPGSQMSAESPMAGRLRAIGQVKDQGITAEPPPMLAAGGAPQEIPGTVANAPMPSLRLVSKLPSQKQQFEADTLQQRADLAAQAAQDRADRQREAEQSRSELAKLAASLKPAPPEKLIKVEHRGLDGRSIVEWLPQSEVRGQTFQKPASGTTENRLASAEAVNQTGDDIIKKLSDPAYAKLVGPAIGRTNTLRDFIGNPPPEFSDLAGMIESYSLANMGVHGMRSAQGAEQIKKLLDQKHTPESLIKTIQGLNAFSSHFMENEGRTPKASTPAALSIGERIAVVGPNGETGTVPKGTPLPPGWRAK